MSWWISLVLFEDCLYSIFCPLFGFQLGSDQIQAFLLSSPHLSFFPLFSIPLLFWALVWRILLPVSSKLTHSLFRWSDLLVIMSIELLLLRSVFYISKSCILLFFRSSRPYYSFMCLAYDFSLCFIFLNIERIVILYYVQ